MVKTTDDKDNTSAKEEVPEEKQIEKEKNTENLEDTPTKIEEVVLQLTPTISISQPGDTEPERVKENGTDFEEINIDEDQEPESKEIHVINIEKTPPKYVNGKKVIEISADFLNITTSDCDSDVNTTRDENDAQDVDELDTAATRKMAGSTDGKKKKIEIATTDDSYESEVKKDKSAKRQVGVKFLRQIFP